MKLSSSNLHNLEILIDELRYKCYKYFNVNNIDNYYKLIFEIKNNGLNFLVEEELLDLVNNHIGIYVYNNKLIIMEDDNILFMVNINNNLNSIQYRNWITLIRLLIGCFNDDYINYNNEEIRLVTKELETLNQLMK